MTTDRFTRAIIINVIAACVGAFVGSLTTEPGDGWTIGQLWCLSFGVACAWDVMVAILRSPVRS